MLAFSNLSTGYRQGKAWHYISTALDGALQRGELVALLGRNGCGKSTLLRSLAALQPVVEGTITIDDASLRNLTLSERARLLAIVLTTKPEALYLTAHDAVAIGRTPYTGFMGRLTAHDSQVIEESLRLTGAEALAPRLLSSLSDGERQRVMIAKALAQQTPYIFLDEPTAFLDFPGKIALLQLLQRLAVKKGKGILFSTHDVELALRLATTLWLLTPEGLRIGTPAELASQGVLSTYFEEEGLSFDAATMAFQLAPSSNV